MVFMYRFWKTLQLCEPITVIF